MSTSTTPVTTVAAPAPKNVWRTVAAYDHSKVSIARGIRNGIGVVIPLVVAIVLGSTSAGIVAATGALNVCFSDTTGPYQQRARRMFASSVLVSIAVTLGGLCGNNHALLVAVATVFAFGAGMLVALDQTAADLGVISLVTLVVFGAQGMTIEHALESGVLAFAGGLVQIVLSVALWRVRRYDPIRRVLADLLSEPTSIQPSPMAASYAPPATGTTTEATDSLAALERDHSIEGERFRMLLSQAERLRLTLLTLGRVRVRLGRDVGDVSEAKTIDGVFQIARELLTAIAGSLRDGRRVSYDPNRLDVLRNAAESLRSCDRVSPLHEALTRDGRFHADALLGQLRTALELASDATPEGIVEFEGRDRRQHWAMRFGGAVAALRANLTLESAACRHAIRLAACILISEVVAVLAGWQRTYWMPMTVALVLKPDFTTTFSRGVLRLGGTFAGLVIATILFHVLTPGVAWQVVLIGLLVFVMRWSGPANYGIVAVCVTAYVVLIFALSGVPPNQTISTRALNTMIGGLEALTAYIVWPTWERTQVFDTIASMLDCYRDYFRAVAQSYIHPDSDLGTELDRTRIAARLARSNAEASVDRVVAEPNTPRELPNVLSAMLASSHRLVHAIMSIEAGLLRTEAVRARDAFRVFANDVEFTLYYQASALRGGRMETSHLPDLREDHHALITTAVAPSDRYALINIETDRITNSLNTLTEEILRLASSREAKT